MADVVTIKLREHFSICSILHLPPIISVPCGRSVFSILIPGQIAEIGTGLNYCFNQRIVCIAQYKSSGAAG